MEDYQQYDEFGRPRHSNGRIAGQKKNALDGILDTTQSLIGVAGFIPGFGSLFDIGNAGISAARGNWGQAAMDLVFAVPGAGDAAALAGKGLKGAWNASKAASGKVAGRFF